MTEPNPYAQQPTPPQPSPYTSYPGEQKTNVLAIIALIAGFVFPLAGIICGHIALSQIKRTGENGRGLALAGTIIGYALTALYLLLGIGSFVFFFVLANSGYSSY